jgi:D-serine deaminase-like pyridoxal phosphate-dependent protein
MERPVSKPVGTPSEELDTPALVVDLDTLERNIETLHSFFLRRDAKVRPHVESHRCPAIAHKQLAAGGTVGGISVTTVGEAEVFAQRGFADIFIANEIVTTQKIARVCSLAKGCAITLAADTEDNVRDLSDAAVELGVTLGVVVDIHTRLERCGVQPGRPAVDLAGAIGRAPGLSFKGLMSYEGVIREPDQDELEAESRRCIQPVLDTREMVERAGMDVEVVSVGGTHNYEIAGDMKGVTEVPAGSYALMDHGYKEYRPQLSPAARVLATVISHPEPGLAWLDLGQKAIGMDTGLPVVDGIPGATVFTMGAEHGGLKLEGDADSMVDLGGKVWIAPLDIGNCVNVYDFVNGVRNGRLEVVWEIEARGTYR